MLDENYIIEDVKTRKKIFGQFLPKLTFFLY